MRLEAREVLARLGMANLTPRQSGPAQDRQMQLSRSAAAVRQRARVLVLDEPNSALSSAKASGVRTGQAAARRGRHRHYVSHRPHEVLDRAIASRSVRDGRIVETLETQYSGDRLIAPW